MCGAAPRRNAWVPALLIVLPAFWMGPAGFGAGQETPPRSEDATGPDDRRVSALLELIYELDADENGVLDPREVSDRARPYVERCARLANLDPSQPLSIEGLAKAVRDYYRQRQGRPLRSPRPGAVSSAEDDGSVLGFGQVEGREPIPGFGDDSLPGGIRVAREDLDRAKERFGRYDRNRDGFLDRHEISHGSWSDDPFRYDRNRDNRLSPQEMAARYAARRAYESRRDDRSSSRSNSEDRRREEEEERRRQREEEERRRRQSYYANRDSYRLAETLVGRYDTNRNGALDPNEWENMGIPASADADGRGRIDRRELAEWLVGRSAKALRGLPAGLPEWFVFRDANQDGQISMAEFAEEWTEAKAAEFGQYDLNEDGIIMPDECIKATTVPVGRYTNHKFQIIPARGTIYSEIEVRDDVRIGDLDVQLSITHTWDETLEVFLYGPKEDDRVELFTNVGGSDDHFKNTILDDEAPTPIVKSRPPFAGRYHPESVTKRERSLRHFYGREVSGTWTLMIRAPRSDRSGVLHGWSLIVTPAKEDTDEAEPSEPEERRDGEPSSESRMDSDDRGRPPYRGPYERRDGDSRGRSYGRPGGFSRSGPR